MAIVWGCSGIRTGRGRPICMWVTVALNSNVCAEHPEIIEEGKKRQWEWMGHNESNTRRLNEATPGEEEQIIKRVLSTIEQHTGKHPAGWLSSGLQETWRHTGIYSGRARCQICREWG